MHRSEYLIIEQDGSLAAWRRKRGPGWLPVECYSALLVLSSILCYNAYTLCFSDGTLCWYFVQLWATLLLLWATLLLFVLLFYCALSLYSSAARECQTVHDCWCQGGPSPLPPPGKQHDSRRPKSGGAYYKAQPAHRGAAAAHFQKARVREARA